jgi:hypothetical protein
MNTDDFYTLTLFNGLSYFIRLGPISGVNRHQRHQTQALLASIVTAIPWNASTPQDLPSYAISITCWHCWISDPHTIMLTTKAEFDPERTVHALISLRYGNAEEAIQNLSSAVPHDRANLDAPLARANSLLQPKHATEAVVEYGGILNSRACFPEDPARSRSWVWRVLPPVSATKFVVAVPTRNSLLFGQMPPRPAHPEGSQVRIREAAITART